MKDYYLTLQEHIIYFKNVLQGYRIPRYVLFAVLGMDFLFVLLHVYTFTLPAVEGSLTDLRLDKDLGYAETFQYFKFICVSALLLLTVIYRKKAVYIVWCIFFLILFLDDAFSFHEILGFEFAQSFNVEPAFGLQAQDIGELAVSGMLGLFFLIPIAYFQFFTAKSSQFINTNYILLFAVLIFFGVGIDVLHSFLEGLPAVGLLTIVEEGGEMLAVSLILWYTYFLYHTRTMETEPYATPPYIIQN